MRNDCQHKFYPYFNFQFYDEEKRKNEDLSTQNQKLGLALADTKSQVQQGDYKIENYDRVKRYVYKSVEFLLANICYLFNDRCLKLAEFISSI